MIIAAAAVVVVVLRRGDNNDNNDLCDTTPRGQSTKLLLYASAWPRGFFPYALTLPERSYSYFPE